METLTKVVGEMSAHLPYIQRIQSTQARHSGRDAKEIRSHVKDCFETCRQVLWQWDKI